MVEDFLANDGQIEVVGLAYNGEEAISLIDEKHPDVLLLDIIMPVLDGIGVLESIKNTESSNKRPKIIMLTAFGHEKITQKAVSLGADYYILKPFKLDILLDRIKQLHSGDLFVSSTTNSLKDRKASNQAHEVTEQIGDIDIVDRIDKIELEQRISEIMQKIGIPAHVKGYSYLRHAILEVIENPEVLEAVTKALYPKIAESYETTSSRVERAIRHAIEIAWNRNSHSAIHELFSNTINSERGKPTNSEMIALIADKIRLNYKRAPK